MTFLKNDLITLIIIVIAIWIKPTTSTSSTTERLKGLDSFIDIE